MTDPDLQMRVPRFAASAALTAALASALVAACSGTGPLATADPSAQQPAATPTAPHASATPSAEPAATRTPCVERQTALTDAKRTVDTARERKASAWKLVVPFAVLARRAQAGNELEAAEKQLAALQAQTTREGCSDGR